MQTVVAPSEVTTVAIGMQRAETLSRLATLYDLITAIQDVVGPDHPDVYSVPRPGRGCHACRAGPNRERLSIL